MAHAQSHREILSALRKSAHGVLRKDFAPTGYVATKLGQHNAAEVICTLCEADDGNHDACVRIPEGFQNAKLAADAVALLSIDCLFFGGRRTEDDFRREFRLAIDCAVRAAGFDLKVEEAWFHERLANLKRAVAEIAELRQEQIASTQMSGMGY